MSKKRRRKTRPAEQPSETQTWPRYRLAVLAGVALLVVIVLIAKGLGSDRTEAVQTAAQVTATLPEAVGQTQATAVLPQALPQEVASVPQFELPEAQLDRLLAEGEPTFAFFHSDNCVQCIKMMQVVDQVYPEFEGSVALVDVQVYDQRNSRLLQRAGIRAIPTQIFFDSQRQGRVVIGAMTPEGFREQMRSLIGASVDCSEQPDAHACLP